MNSNTLYIMELSCKNQFSALKVNQAHLSISDESSSCMLILVSLFVSYHKLILENRSLFKL